MSTTELEVGRIGRPHGVRGVVKVELYWSSSSALEGNEALTLRLVDGTNVCVATESRSRAGRGWLVKFVGVDDREAAQRFTNAKIFVPRAALPPLEEGEAYLVDLVGAEVIAPDGLVGEVVDIVVHPSVDAVVIRCPDGRTVEQALLPAFVARLDPVLRRIELSTRDGLIV